MKQAFAQIHIDLAELWRMEVWAQVQGDCHRYDFLVRLNRMNLYIFQTFILSSLGIDHDPPCFYVHMTYVYSFSHVSIFTRSYGQEKSLSYYDLFDFGVFLHGRILTLIPFYLLHNSTTPILPVYVDKRRPHLEKDTTRARGMVIWQSPTVLWRTPVTPD